MLHPGDGPESRVKCHVSEHLQRLTWWDDKKAETSEAQNMAARARVRWRLGNAEIVFSVSLRQ